MPWLASFAGYLNDTFLKQLAKEIGKDYGRFGKLLHVKPLTIRNIEGDKDKVVDRAYEILKAWKYATEKPDSYAAYVILRDAAEKLETGVVDLIRRGESIEASKEYYV